MILKILSLNNNNLYNIADNKTKNMANTYIEELKEKGLLQGYFGALANNIYSRTRVKNNEILELFIYGEYIEEQAKLDNYEQQIMYDDVNYYYAEGQKEVNDTLKKKKPISIIDMALFLYLLDQPNYTGLNYKQCILATIQYNAQQLYRQALINIQQQKELEIENSEFQRILNQQQNTKLCINDDRLSGFMDTQLIGLNNQAKVEGIKELDKNATVQFISDQCDNVTIMCSNMDKMTFKINDWNIFDRYYGETAKELKIERIKIKGLVLGLNLPPINHHFHWCHSHIVYLPVEKVKETEYNLDIPKISKEVKQILKNTKLNKNTKRLFNRYLTKENVIIDNNNTKSMYYDAKQDKIIINPKHQDFQQYNLEESLSHEIMHLIEKRNNISLDIDNQLRKLELEVGIDSSKYNELFNKSEYSNNMCLSDLFSAISNNKIKGNYYHSSTYWSSQNKKISEIMANIETIYLRKDKTAMSIIENIRPLKEIKEKVVKKYNEFTR